MKYEALLARREPRASPSRGKGVLAEKVPANVSSIWKVFANLPGTSQVQLYGALFREENVPLQGMGQLSLGVHCTGGQNLCENLPEEMMLAG